MSGLIPVITREIVQKRISYLCFYEKLIIQQKNVTDIKMQDQNGNTLFNRDTKD